MPTQQKDPAKTTAGNDRLEKSAAKQEKGPAATEGIVGEDQLDAAIGDEGDDSVTEQTSAVDDPLETAEAKKEDH
ncbi:putative Histone chaperone domain-containing protein [Seiridium unicorne]|uniref:Histone chaperone domain-containing protein n=1 Tax=Seiridium unicorne TaxID=138068 RepID=A0ABR2USH7_9PEZI